MIYTFVFGTCEFGAEQWEEGLGGLKIYHFWELFFFYKPHALSRNNNTGI